MPAVYYKTGQSLPVGVSDNSQAQYRGGKYGELATTPQGRATGYGTDAITAEGAYWNGTSWGTDALLSGFPTANQSSFTDTAPTIILRNLDSIKSLSLDYILLTCSTTGGTIVGQKFIIVVDTVNRYISGGINNTFIHNINTNQPQGATEDFGPIELFCGNNLVTSAAGGTARIVSASQFKASNAIAGDRFLVSFANTQFRRKNLFSSTAGAFTIQAGPVIIGPQHTCLMYYIGQAALNMAISIGFYRR